MDSILGYHMNPLTCGVARFNRALGDQTGLAVHQMFSAEALTAENPLLSFKVSEMPPAALARLEALIEDEALWPGLRLFFHDYSHSAVEARLIARATKVYCGNPALAAEISPMHPNVVEAWCPGYLFEAREFDDEAEVRIYTFGMAHKLRADYFYRLHEMLEATGKRYVVYVSAAIHEDTSLDDSFTAAYEELRAIFGDKVFFLGFVSDAALHAFLKTCTYFAAFFQTGVRANNSSVSTAMQAGAAVLTNLDADSPPGFRHLESVVDILQCDGALPLDPALLARVAENGKAAAEAIGWSPLLALLAREEAAT